MSETEVVSNLPADDLVMMAEELLANDTEDSLVRAIDFLSTASEQGHPYAPLRLGYLIARDGTNESYLKAFPYFLRSFELTGKIKDNPLPYYYDGFSGVVENKDEMRKLIKQGHNEGDLGHSLALAREHLNQNSPWFNKVEGINILNKLVGLNFTPAKFDLGLHLCNTGSSSRGLPLLKDAADGGIIDALITYGVFLREGTHTKQNGPEARRYFMAAIEMGDVDAMFELGILYRNGASGLYRNPVESEHWLSMANKKGHPTAYIYLTSNKFVAICNKLPKKSQQAKLLKACKSLEDVFFSIREKHMIRSNMWLSHFTNWDALESILPTTETGDTTSGMNVLRQYHVDYMNDPTEGFRLLRYEATSSTDKSRSEVAKETSRFLNTLFSEKYHSTQSDSPVNGILPSVFICSLTKEGDRLDLWRAYGRDGQGYCISFDFNGSLLNNEKILRNRLNHRLHPTGDDSSEHSTPPKSIPLLYEIFYNDSDVEDTLIQLSKPLHDLMDIAENFPAHASDIRSCIAEILLELLYLYKDIQYVNEREVRAITVCALGDSSIKADKRSPGRLFIETPPFLFRSDAKIIAGPKVKDVDLMPAIWNLRWRIKKHDYNSNVYVQKSQVKYR